jgi:predicted enzyme related to lactoylglutathione lyase
MGAGRGGTVTLRISTCTIDAVDPAALAAFWSEALGWRVQADADGDVWVESQEEDAGSGSTPLLFISDPEAKSVKNRIHFDLRPDDQAAEVERLQRLGAHPADIGQSGSESWVVMADPEGNEFCVLSSKPNGPGTG